MVDNTAYVLKIVFLIIGVWSVYKGRLSHLSILIIPIFMTGVELISPYKEPWNYLIFGNTSIDDYQRAFFGGAIMIGYITSLYLLFTIKVARMPQPPPSTKE